MTLLYNHLFAIHDIDSGTDNLLYATAKEVVDNLPAILGAYSLDASTFAADGP